MALVKRLPNVQTVLSAVFELNATDTMVNLLGNTVAFGKTTSAANTTYGIWTPPPNAIIISGRIVNLTVWATSSANTIDVGDSDDTDRYTETGAIDLQDADAPTSGVDLLGDGKIYTGNQKIEFLITNSTADATAGRSIVILNYIVLGRASENIITT